MRTIQEKFNTSLFLGELPKGCQLCHVGSKIVLFITGLCERPNYCKWYCPISLERRGKDLSYVNEIQINSESDIIAEAKLMNAEGAAITGGEPLFRYERTINYIRLLKTTFGENFHIHLYTNSINLTKLRLQELKSAGLDEIRLHPPLQNLEKVKWCITNKIDVGIEIPAIPYQYQKVKSLLRFLDKVGAFLNLNEFEITESNANYLKMFGFTLKKDTIAAVEGSEFFGLKILQLARPLKLNVHYCSIGYKDGIQLKMRYLRRAKNVVRPHEIITDEGLIMKGIIFQKNSTLKDLENLMHQLIQKFEIDSSLLVLNPEKLRLEISVAPLKQIGNYLKERNFNSGIVEELPLTGTNRIQMTFTPLELI